MSRFEQAVNNFPTEIKLVDCDISIRALNYLKSINIHSLNDCTLYTEDELKQKLPGVNKLTFREVRDLLTEHGLDFKQS